MIKYEKQMFANEYDGGEYCDFSASAASAIAGKDILLAVWDATGANILAVAGQKTLTINRSAETIDVSTKDTEQGWGASIAGAKSWSIDVDGLYVTGDASQEVLSNAFTNGNLVCVKVYNNKTHKGMFGGLAAITDYPIEAPYDDSVSFSITLSGCGPLTDLTIDEPTTDTLPS